MIIFGTRCKSIRNKYQSYLHMHMKLKSNLQYIKCNKNKITDKIIFENIHTNINDNINIKLNKIVHNYLLKDCNISIGSYILLCVSGGLDSMAMLHLLVNINKTLSIPYNLEIINFNHKIRQESDIEV